MECEPGGCGGVLCAPRPDEGGEEWVDPNPEDPDWRKFAEELGENPHRGGDSGWDPPETGCDCYDTEHRVGDICWTATHCYGPDCEFVYRTTNHPCPDPKDDDDEECCCEAVDIAFMRTRSRTVSGKSERKFSAQPIVRARHDADRPAKCTLKWEELGNSTYRPARGTPVVPADKRVDLTEHPVFKGSMAKQALADLEDPCSENIAPIEDVPNGGTGRWIIFHIVLRSGCPDGATIERWLRFWVDAQGAHIERVPPNPPAWKEAPRGRFR